MSPAAINEMKRRGELDIAPYYPDTGGKGVPELWQGSGSIHEEGTHHRGRGL